jgi:hypothetical protein
MTTFVPVCVINRLQAAIVTISCCMAVLAATPSAPAGLIFSIESKTVHDMSQGNSLDVTLTNTGSVAVSVGGFAFEVNSPSSHIQFTSATVDTTLVPYIFGTQSLFGPRIDIGSGVTLVASDLYGVVASGVEVGSGQTVGLGHLFFDSTSTQVEKIRINFSLFPGSSLSDGNGNDLSITSFVDGLISVVPEPATRFQVLAGIACISLALRRRQRKTGVGFKSAFIRL